MGAWIEIFTTSAVILLTSRRTPRWVRGLKYYTLYNTYMQALSHPTMGAWIEIKGNVQGEASLEVAPHDGCVD